jgi:predicted nicotinamide N-methyase
VDNTPLLEAPKLWFLLICAAARAMDGGGLSPELDFDAPPPDGPLLLRGKLFPLNWAAGELTIHGLPIFAMETPNSGLGTGTTVWDGSVVLAKHLEARYPPLGLSGRRVVELGAGPGVAGFAAAALGAAVTLTDLPYCLPNLEAAAQRNAHLPGASTAAALDWFAVEPALAGAPALAEADLVLGADVVWVEELIPGLVGALAALLRRPGSVALVAHQTRSTRSDELLFRLLAEARLMVALVPREQHHPAFSDDIIDIFTITGAPMGEGREL